MIPQRTYMVHFVMVGILFGMAPVTVCGQDEKNPPPTGYDKTSATVEAIMTQAVKNIGVRYNLNEHQLKLTDELMKRDVRRFLTEHENEIWPAIRSIISYGMGTKPPANPQEAKRFAKTARPLVELAKEAIFNANAEWRDILSDEQKKVHYYDMQEMRKTFDHINSSLAAWESGHGKNAPIFPPPPVPNGSEPPHPSRPRIQVTKTGSIISTPDPGILATITEEFIREYHLDDAQVTAARSILVEFKGKAESFRTSNAQAFARIAADMNKAERARDTKARKAAATAHKELLRPFYRIIEEMQDRLRGLLTSGQIELYTAKHAPKATESAPRKAAPAQRAPKANKKPRKAPAPVGTESGNPGEKMTD
ncbi:MAG: hypothetical protein ACE5E5_02515 [Phycisphaerae bacterium]